jgi:hypothetical protein
LERSAAQYDRLAGAGAAAELLISSMLDERERRLDYLQGLDPQTLVFYVSRLRAVSRELRRWRRATPPPRRSGSRAAGGCAAVSARPHRSRGRA